MFDFERLKVYQKVKHQNKRVLSLIYGSSSMDKYSRDQWKRCTLSVALNIAEATGRVGKSEKKYFYTVARGSVCECVAILDALSSIGVVSSNH
jgi:four helix bundle protein